jgi:hypothetical protein
VEAAVGGQIEAVVAEVPFLPELIIPQAAASLRALLQGSEIPSGYLKSLDQIHLPQQLHAAMKNLVLRLTPAQKGNLATSLQEWISACVQVAPTSVTGQDRQNTLQAVNAHLLKLPDDVDWFGVASDIVFGLPPAWESVGRIQAAVDGHSLRVAIRDMVRGMKTKSHLLTFQQVVGSVLQSLYSTKKDDPASPSVQIHM